MKDPLSYLLSNKKPIQGKWFVRSLMGFLGKRKTGEFIENYSLWLHATSKWVNKSHTDYISDCDIFIVNQFDLSQNMIWG